MKKFILFLSIAFTLASCKTIQTGISQPEFSYDGKKLCLKQSASATINQDSLYIVLQQGIKVGNDTNYVILKYVNGTLSATGQGCVTIVK